MSVMLTLFCASLLVVADAPGPIDVAKKLDELCRAEKLEEAQDLFYCPNDFAKENAEKLATLLKKNGIHKVIEELARISHSAKKQTAFLGHKLLFNDNLWQTKRAV